MATNIMEFWLFDFCNFRCGYYSLGGQGALAHESRGLIIKKVKA